MTDYRIGFRGPYVTAVELEGRTPTLQIDRVQLEMVPAIEPGQPDRERWIVYFRGAKRGWVLNRTNAECLVAMFGADVSKWPGHEITLHTTKVRVGSKTELGIRVLGSPELQEPMQIEIRLPHRRPTPYTLQPTRREGA